MCCGCKKNVFIICMATWTLFQSLLYATLALLGILVHQCELNMDSDKLSYIWYLIYFRRGECGLVEWSNLDLNIPSIVQPIWPEVTQVAYRANIMIIIYLSLSVAWIITSMGLICAACTSCVGRCYFNTTLTLWSTVGILILCADASGTALFIYDLVHVTDFASLLEFLEITNTQQLIDAAGDFDAPFYLPSVLMMITAARGFILWIFNVVIVVVVIRFGMHISKRIPKSINDNRSRPIAYENARNNNNRNDNNRNVPYTQENNSNGMYPMRSPSQYTSPQQPYNNNQHRNNQYNDSIPRVVPTAAMISPQGSENSRGYHNQAYEENIPPIMYPINRQKVQSDNTNQNSSQGPQPIADNARTSSPSRSSKPVPPQKPPKPILKVKNYPIDQLSNDGSSERSERNSLQIPPEELRSQLPWSYTSNPEDLNKPKRTFVALRDDEDLPPVPVPDYTLHFPKNKRSGLANEQR